MTKIEAGHYEFNTFDFDLEKVLEKSEQFKDRTGYDEKQNLSDFEKFFMLFPEKRLAEDLFTIFEHGRLNYLLTDKYPGLLRQSKCFLKHEAKLIFNKKSFVTECTKL